MSEVTYREARLDDAGEILAVLIELAPEIPVQVVPLEREEALYVRIRHCVRSGGSWVAAEQGRIIGVVLAAPDQTRRHYAEHEIVELHYGGVVASHRRQGIFTTLVKRALDRALPVMASVSPANRSGAVELLKKLGFREVRSSGGEPRLRWDPGAVPSRRG